MKMHQTKLTGVLILFVTSVVVRCESGEDMERNFVSWGMRRYPTYDYNDRPSCENEYQIALAEIKLEIQNLQQLLVGLRQKLDPDFKLEPPVKVESKCPPGFKYAKLARSCYKVVYEEHNWASADQRCHDLHPEAHLVSMTTKDEHIGLKAYLKRDLAKNSRKNVCKLRSWGNPSQMLWTSGQQLNETSCKEPFVWKLSNNTQLPLSFTHWYPNEPNCSGNKEPCIHLIPTDDFSWNDIRCSEMLCPLCEYNPS